jgi:hypothetical protein
LEEFIVVADSGLMNRKNIAMLESGGCKFIVGARIKNEEDDTKQWILSLKKAMGILMKQTKAMPG